VFQSDVETTPKPVADAPDTTTTKKQTEDPTKLDQSGDPKAEKTSGKGSGARGSKKGKS
jgi:hypothetical protein